MDMRIPDLEWLPASLLGWFAETTAIAAVLAVVAWTGSRSGRIGPASRHALWLVVLIKLMMPPLVHWPEFQMTVEPGKELSDARRVPPNDLAETIDAGTPVHFPPVIRGDRGGFPVSLASLSEPPPTPPDYRRRESDPDGRVAASDPADADDRRSQLGDIALAPSVRQILPQVKAWAFGAWAVGSLVMVLIGTARIARFHRQLEFAVPAPRRLIEEADHVAAMLRVNPPAIWVVPGLLSPLLWCLGKPRLLIPRHLVDTLEPDRWRGILAHELAHIRRGDPWVCRLELLAGILWWWNPLFRLARYQIDAEAELACDAWVVSTLPDDRLTYAESLLEVCAGPSRPNAFVRIGTPALGIAGPGRFFEKRLTMILRDRVSCRLSAPIVLAASLLMLVSAPAWTHATPADDKATPKPAPDAKPEPKPAPDAKPEPKPAPDAKPEPKPASSKKKEASHPSQARSPKSSRSVANEPEWMQGLGDRIEKAWGRSGRLNLEQYMTEMGRLAAASIAEEAARNKLLHDAMSHAIDVTIAKYESGSEASKEILAQQLKQMPSGTVNNPEAVLKVLDVPRGNLALNETKKLFWANVYPKLNLPDKTAAFEPLEPNRVVPKEEIMLRQIYRNGNVALTRKQVDEVQKQIEEAKQEARKQIEEVQVEAKKQVEEANKLVKKLVAKAKADSAAGTAKVKAELGEVAAVGPSKDKKKRVAEEDSKRAKADAEIDEKIQAEFKNDPEVAKLLKEIEDKEKELARVGNIARNTDDPALLKLKKEIIALDLQFKKLWQKKHDAIRERNDAEKKKDDRLLTRQNAKKERDRERRIRAIEQTIQKLLDEVKQLREEAAEDDNDE